MDKYIDKRSNRAIKDHVWSSSSKDQGHGYVSTKLIAMCSLAIHTKE